jgi:hypothetical protein
MRRAARPGDCDFAQRLGRWLPTASRRVLCATPSEPSSHLRNRPLGSLAPAVLGVSRNRGCQGGPTQALAALSDYAAFPILSRTCVRYADAVGTWHDLNMGRPIAAPLERCAELLGVDLATIREAAANVEPYLRTDNTRIWSLMQLAPTPARDLQAASRRLPRPPTDPSDRRVETAPLRRLARSSSASERILIRDRQPSAVLSRLSAGRATP